MTGFRLGLHISANLLPTETQRDSLSQSKVLPTSLLNEYLPDSLQAIFRLIGKEWHKNTNAALARLGPRFLSEPLCLIGGSRFDPSRVSANRFALALIMTEDYVNKRSDYHILDGAMAVSQVAQLGLKLESILKIKGDIESKFRELLRYPADDSDNTIYELLTAVAFMEKGYDVTIVSVDPPNKTPDLAIDMGGINYFVECKRKARFAGYETNEAMKMLEAFAHIRKELIAEKLAGKIDLNLFWPSHEIAVHTIVGASMSAIRRKGAVYFPWGSCSFTPLPQEIKVPLTRVYSPSFVKAVTGYDMELCQNDGLILQVLNTREFDVDLAAAPVAIAWTNFSNKSIDKKARAISSLFGKAISQFPKQSIGIPYICYTENNGSRLADLRTTNMMEDMQEWYHNASVLIPAACVSRLYAMPDKHGNPDLIENSVEFRSSDLSAEDLPDFPTCVFTKSLR